MSADDQAQQHVLDHPLDLVAPAQVEQRQQPRRSSAAARGLLAVIERIPPYSSARRVHQELIDQLTDFDVDKGTLRFQPGALPADELIERIVAARRADIDRR